MEQILRASDDGVAGLICEIEELRAAVGKRSRAIELLEMFLKYYANPDTPQSTNSLE